MSQSASIGQIPSDLVMLPKPGHKDNGLLRYLIQFVIPALIFLGVVYAVTRRRRQPHHDQDDSASTFLAILVIGAVVAVATLFVLQVNWNAW